MKRGQAYACPFRISRACLVSQSESSGSAASTRRRASSCRRMTEEPPRSPSSAHSSGKNRAREQAGVAAMAVVGRADDAARVLPPVLHDAQDRFLPQKRLVGDHVEDPGAVRHGLGAEADGPADAVVRAVIPDGMKPGLLRLLQKRRILGNDGDAGKRVRGDRSQRERKQALAGKARRQLVFPEAGRISCRHDEAADGSSGKFRHGQTPCDFPQISIGIFAVFRKKYAKFSTFTKKVVIHEVR